MPQIAAIQSLRARPTGLLRLQATLRSGSWLTPERLRVYPILIGTALALAMIALVATGHGAKDRWDRPLGVDFSGVWVAGQAVEAGHPAQPYDNAAHAAAQARAFGPSDSYLPWPYPPYFLAVAGLLAALPYLAALAVWQGGTCLLYLAAVLKACPRPRPLRRDLVVAGLAFPAVTINLVHGQNGFLTTALLAFGAMNLTRRPLLAGLLLGLLVYKPQFLLVVPVAILGGGHWRAGAAGLATALAATAATLVAFGSEPWQGFVASLSFSRHVILEGGGLESYKLQSAFAAVRLWSGSVSLAYAVQGAVALAVLGGLASLWRGAAAPELKFAGLLVASLLATPYVLDYDMVLLGPALAAMVSFSMGQAPHRACPFYMKTLLALAWVAPLVARIGAMSLHVPLGFGVTALLYGATLLWAHRSSRTRLAPATDATVPFLPR